MKSIKNAKATLILIVNIFLCQMPIQAAEVVMGVDKVNALVGTELIFNLTAEDLTEAYVVDIELSYNPEIIEVLDQDINKPGVQLVSGEFMQHESSFYVRNSVDSELGKIQLVYARLYPAPPVSGDGVILSLATKLLQKGDSYIYIDKLEFGTAKGELIKAEYVQAYPFTIFDNQLKAFALTQYVWVIGIMLLVIITTVFLYRKKGVNNDVASAVLEQ